MVEPQYRPNLIQALTRSPFHPCSTWEKHMKNLSKTPSESPKVKYFFNPKIIYLKFHLLIFTEQKLIKK